MRLLVCLLLIGSIAGCASDKSRTPQQVQEERNDPPPTEPEAPTVPNLSPFGA